MTSDLLSTLEVVCINDNALYKSTFTLPYFTLPGSAQAIAQRNDANKASY